MLVSVSIAERARREAEAARGIFFFFFGGWVGWLVGWLWGAWRGGVRLKVKDLLAKCISSSKPPDPHAARYVLLPAIRRFARNREIGCSNISKISVRKSEFGRVRVHDQTIHVGVSPDLSQHVRIRANTLNSTQTRPHLQLRKKKRKIKNNDQYQVSVA